MFQGLRLILVGSALIITITAIKYKPVYAVTLSGETIGYISSKTEIDTEINEYLNDTEGNIAFRVASDLPEYNFTLISRSEDTEEEKVLLAVEEQISTTYETYAITIDGETKADVASEEEAMEIVEEIKSDISEEIEMSLGVTAVYSEALEIDTKEEALASLTEIKEEKVSDYETAKAEAAAEAAKKIATSSATSYASASASTTQATASGSLSGMALSIPVSGSISSRFGSRSSSRSTVHTGLDISTPSGTGIRPISAGTVTFAAYNGSYGYMIKIDHGNGVESWYAHCSALYVNVGDYVDTSSTIAAVGSTGNSTGPHLHLEIRINGTAVDPQNYLYN